MVYPNANNTFAGGTGGVTWRMKWAYEFWGFCVNGTASTTIPGGFPTNGVNFPTNFTGGTSLLASGTDGSHDAVSGDLFSGDCIFTSASATFNTAMVGKAIVIWKANSNSSEDSIYLITRVISATQLMININTGGTPNASTKHPSMTARTGVNYRIVDMVVGAVAGFVNGTFMVFQTDASSINPGQANSQFSLTQQWDTSANTTNFGNTSSALWAAGMSGSGSWNGSTLTVSSVTGAGVSPIVVTTSTPHGFITGQTVNIAGVGGNTNANGMFLVTSTGANTFSLSGLAGVSSGGLYYGTVPGTTTGNGTYTSGGTVYNGFQNDGYATFFAANPNTNAAYSGGQTAITMIADKTFMLCHVREQDLFQNNLQISFHFEIPTRLYPQGQDLHPMAILFTTTNGLNTSSTSGSYGGGFTMRTHSGDAVTNRPYRTLVKALRGDGTPDVFGQSLSDYRVGYNTIAGTIPISDGLLCLPGITNQYQLARIRLRTVKFTGTHVPKHHRIGLNGEFIQMQNGICWPWDNAIIPHQLILFGA